MIYSKSKQFYTINWIKVLEVYEIGLWVNRSSNLQFIIRM